MKSSNVRPQRQDRDGELLGLSGPADRPRLEDPVQEQLEQPAFVKRLEPHRDERFPPVARGRFRTLPDCNHRTA